MTPNMTYPDNTEPGNGYEVPQLTPREHTRELRRRGIYGEEVGGVKIYDQLVKVYGAAHSEMPSPLIRASAIRAVNRWIKGVEYEGLDVPYVAKVTDPAIRSFAGRLDLVKSAYLDGERLTKRELPYVRRLLNEFQDPFGEDVDLVAQFAVVWELSEREAMDKESADIETMFAFAPWQGKANSDLYLLAVEKGLVKSPPILRFISPVVPYGEMLLPPEYMVGAYAQLGLPWFAGSVQEHPQEAPRMVFNSRRKDSEVPMTIEHWKPACNWKQLVEARLTDKPTQRVKINIDRGGSDND